MWCPRIDSDSEQYVHSCQTSKNKDPKFPLFSLVVPQKVWSHIHIDYAGPYDGLCWPVVVDKTAKWLARNLSNQPTKKIIAEKTMLILEELLTLFGIPKIIVNNSTQLTLHVLQTFCTKNNVQYPTIFALFHPRSNGLVERYVQMLKK